MIKNNKNNANEDIYKGKRWIAISDLISPQIGQTQGESLWQVQVIQ